VETEFWLDGTISARYIGYDQGREKERSCTMRECEYLARCPFFNDQMRGMPSMAEHIKAHYCRGIFAECARYQVVQVLGPGSAPPDLFPIQTARVEEIVTAGKK